MKRKMYVLKTWMYDSNDNNHPTNLSVYISDGNENAKNKKVPYITTSRLAARKFNTKKDALAYGKQFGDCYVDTVWHFTKECNGETLDLWG